MAVLDSSCNGLYSRRLLSVYGVLCDADSRGTLRDFISHVYGVFACGRSADDDSRPAERPTGRDVQGRGSG